MSTPRINPNDPKWTAYVLGELDEADRASVERLLEASAEARALVNELKVAASRIDEALSSESADLLTAAQRSAVRVAADAGRARWFAEVPRPWALGLGAAAAAVIVASVVQMQPQSRRPAVRPDGDIAPAHSVTAPTPSRPTVAPVPPATEIAVSTPLPSSSTPPRSATPANPPAVAAAPTFLVEPSTTVNPGGAATTLTGSIRDASGGVMPGVTVTAVNSASGVARSTVTDTVGQYRFDNVQPGEPYRLTATLSGFRAASADVQAAPGTAQRDFTMSVGALAETVVVTGETPAVDVQNARQQIVQGQQGQNGAQGGGGRGGGRGGSAANQGRVNVPAGMAGGVVAGLADAPAVAAPPPSAVRPAFPSDGAVFFPRPPIGTESYARVAENTFVRVSQEPLATFSIDVDTASYSNVRRFLNMNQLPPADAVRIEELVNYFTYDYARPSGVHPIGASMEVADAPWNSAHRLVRIGIKARDIDAKQRPPSNLVFLIDVSGSMNMPQKLPLVKSGLKMLVEQLGENDMVSIVVYAGTSGLVLPTTSGERKQVISQAIDNLQAGGSTNGGAGIQLAYQQAANNFIRGGVNRVILVTDGDFNVGITSQGELTRLIEDRAKSGVFLSVLGFGMGNLKDSTMERLADMGNGHYAYIDTLNEARKVLVEEMSSTLVTVAKDVKIQVDFNPAKVEAYRLIGYENRALRPEDFNNDLKDAGEMGAGHAVTALFEIVPRGGSVPGPSIDPSVFQPAPPRATPVPASNSNDLLVLRVRYKLPDASESTRMDVPLPDRRRSFADASPDFRFAASVAAFGMVLKNSQYRGDVTLPWVLDTATGSRGQDRSGYRAEFISLVQRAMSLGTALGR
ncbi:MAG TPA: von Willebrand factor type A domain-containing protein [Vicinamibacterales bacterium]|nr:von Willebrand factor type A domain-containing protein [Vicinamibacterales bacterium]